MMMDCPPAIHESVPGKYFCIYYSHGGHYGQGRGWWAHIEGYASPFGAWRMDRGPYPFKWMARLEFPIERLTRDGPRR